MPKGTRITMYTVDQLDDLEALQPMRAVLPRWSRTMLRCRRRKDKEAAAKARHGYSLKERSRERNGGVENGGRRSGLADPPSERKRPKGRKEALPRECR
jgi:hypothetical protein